MIYGIGTDIIEINRIERAMKRNSKFINRIFTDEELKYYETRNFNPQHIAGGFAGKEAVLKALGTGLRNFRWKDIEILRDQKGKPYVKAESGVKQYIAENGIYNIHITISHSRDYALATAIAEVMPISEVIGLGEMLFGFDEGASRRIH